MIKKWGLNLEESEEVRELPALKPSADILTSEGSIRSIDNTVFFYSSVGVIECADLNRILREIDTRLRLAKEIMNAESFTPTIHLRINSYGGDLFAGLSVVDTIRSLSSHVYTYVEGAAASAATLISVCGKKRFIGKNSFMLVHQLSSISSGTFEQLEDNHENNKRLMALIKSVYKQYTKITMKDLDNILKHDIWWNSEECLKHGMIDEII